MGGQGQVNKYAMSNIPEIGSHREDERYGGHLSKVDKLSDLESHTQLSSTNNQDARSQISHKLSQKAASDTGAGADYAAQKPQEDYIRINN